MFVNAGELNQVILICGLFDLCVELLLIFYKNICTLTLLTWVFLNKYIFSLTWHTTTYLIIYLNIIYSN